MDCVKKEKFFHFWAFSAKMVNFGQFMAKMGKTGIFQKSVYTFLSRLQALTNCKVSEKKVMCSFWATAWRMDGRTRIRKVYLLRRETKNGQNTDLNNQNEFGGPLKSQKMAKNEFTHGKN